MRMQSGAKVPLHIPAGSKLDELDAQVAAGRIASYRQDGDRVVQELLAQPSAERLRAVLGRPVEGPGANPPA